MSARRLRSVDAFRGLVLAVMVLTPATGQAEHFPLLRHAAWDGATVSDLVFPTFLVTSGISLSFLLRPPSSPTVTLRLVRRTAALVVVGLVYNAYGASGFDLGALRFTGVLQTIGVTGAITAIAVMATRRRGRDRPWLLVAFAAGLTALYWIGFRMLEPCQPDGACNPWFGLDRSVLGETHTYAGGARGFDPEGIAVTVAASALVVAGYLAGLALRRHAMAVSRFAPRVAATGAVLAMAGLATDSILAFNKRLLTPSFVLLAAGVALVAFAAVAVIVDMGDFARRARAVATAPLVALGRNALIVFVAERFLLQTAKMTHVGEATLEAWAIEHLPIGEPGVHIAYTGAVLAVIVAVVGVLHRRRWYLAL